MTSSQARFDEPGAPAIRVTGRASAQEVAAIVTVLAAASGGAEEPSSERGSPWASHEAALRRPVSHAQGAWRTSLRP